MSSAGHLQTPGPEEPPEVLPSLVGFMLKSCKLCLYWQLLPLVCLDPFIFCLLDAWTLKAFMFTNLP